MRRKLIALAALLVLPIATYACANDDTAAPGPKDHSKDPPVPTAGADASDAATDSAATDATPVEVQKCKQADFDAPASAAGGGDLTAMATVPITFPMGGGPMQYTNRCAKVKLGSMVTFTGSFASHPLAPAGGDPGTQIPSQNADPPGGSVSFTVTTKGTFGYHCGFHPSDMFGAIQVVP